MTEVDEPLGPNNPRHDRKRPFHGEQMSSQTCLRQDHASTTEDELILSCTTYRAGPPPHIEEENMRRCADNNGHHDYHAEKRSRTSDWPLRNANITNEATFRPRVVLRDQYDKSNSTSPHLHAVVKLRPSKFVEGSMKDRASQKPHPSYTEDSGQSWTHIEPKRNFSSNLNREAQLDGYMDRIDTSLVCNSRLEISKSSSIFRFGKSIAAAFNPSTWKIWLKQQEEDSHDKRVLTERHEKAEKIYKELKRTGQLSAFAHQTRSEAQDKTTSSDKHDSGVSFKEGVSWTGTTHRIKSSAGTNVEEKRHGRVFLNSPRIDSSTYCENATSEISASSNPFLQSSEPTNQLTETLDNPQVLRRLPSRKDLQRQQKLVKRVSDLEGKLDAARRQLAEVLGDPLPKEASRINRSRVIPSTLPSLPSERLLGVHVAPNPDLSETAEVLGIGKALSIENRTGSHFPSENPYKVDADAMMSTSSEICGILAGQNVGSGTADEGPIEQTARYTRQDLPVRPAAVRNTTKKRKALGAGLSGNGGTYSQNPSSAGDDGFEAAEPSIPKRGPGRPRKLQKTDPEPDYTTAEAIEAEPSFEASSTLPLHGRKTKHFKRSPVGLATKAVPQTNNTRIAKNDQTETMPTSPNFTSSSEFTYTGTEVSNGKSVVHYERDEIIRGFNSIEVPPIPEPLDIVESRKAALANNRVTLPCTEIDAYGDVGLEQKGPRTPNTDAKTSRVRNKQAFEWPADVF